MTKDRIGMGTEPRVHWWRSFLGRPLQPILLALVMLVGVTGVSAPAGAVATPAVVVTNCNATGTGSLRAAITTANAHSGTTITFALSPACSKIPTSSTYSIVASMTIAGPGAGSLMLDGANAHEVLTVASSVQVTISGLTIENGFEAAGGVGQSGQNGGGISNQGTLKLSDDVIWKNSAGRGGTGKTSSGSVVGGAGGPGGSGGGIFNSGMLTLTGCTVSNNAAGTGGQGGGNTTTGPGGPGGTGGNGGGIYNSGHLIIKNSTVLANLAGGGGQGGTATGLGASGGQGGGIFNSGQLTATNDTFTKNTSGAGGYDAANSTRGTAGGGGAIFVTSGTASATLIASTVNANSAAGNGQGAGIQSVGGTVSVGSTILVLNVILGTGSISNCGNSVAVKNLGANVETGTNCGFFTLKGSLNYQSPTEISLGTLGSNGGPTQTEAITPFSSAYHLVSVASGLCPSQDQRGVPRPRPSGSAACDAGAFEYAAPVPITNVKDDASGVTVGGTFTFTASVEAEGQAPTGTVTWAIIGPGSPSCGPTILSSTIATCTVHQALAGHYVTTASYGGDTYYTRSSASDSATIGRGSPTVTVSDSSSGVVTGGAFSCKAKVSGPVTAPEATGYVIWILNGPNQPTCLPEALSVGSVTCTVSPVEAGTYGAAAVYEGDSNYLVGAGLDQSATVGKAIQTVVFTSAVPIGAVVGGSPYKVTAKGGGSGQPVIIAVNPSSAAVCSISGSTVNFIGPGTCVLVANQAGNAYYTVATAVGQSFAISKASTKTRLTVSPTTVGYGAEQTTRFSVTVSPQFSGFPPGTVTIFSGASKLCTMTLSAGRRGCSPRSTALKPGTWKIKAVYAGSPGFLGSTSGTVTWKVT